MDSVLYISFSSYMIAIFAGDIVNGLSTVEKEVVSSKKGKRA